MRTKRQALEAAAHNRELEKLYAFARDLPTDAGTEGIIAQFLDRLVGSFENMAAAFYDRGTGQAIRSGRKIAPFRCMALRTLLIAEISQLTNKLAHSAFPSDWAER